VRQPPKATEVDQSWLIARAPPKPASTANMTDEELRFLYPNAPKALPPELTS
jgi:hypothetical protein